MFTRAATQRRDDARAVADQPVDTDPHELARTGRCVDGPGEDDARYRAELGDGARVEQALVHRHAVLTRVGEPVEQRPQLTPAADRGQAADGQPVEDVEQMPRSRADRESGPGRYGSISARTIFARRDRQPSRSSISSMPVSVARRSSDRTSDRRNGDASVHRSQ